METQKVILKITENGIAMEMENCDPITALGLLRFYEKDLWLQIENAKIKYLSEAEKKEKEKQNEIFFYYHPEMKIKIEINDLIEILPSENCVTNADYIKYNENISGARGTIKKIDFLNKQALISFQNFDMYVHTNWLKLISKQKQ